MVKFNQPVRPPRATPTVTHEGGSGYRPPLLTELAFTAACTYAGEDTFYESGQDRLDRLVHLVRDATDRNPTGVAKFVTELRERYLIRSASVVVACEYAKRVQELGYPARGYPPVADVIDSACARADEPGEVVAYWRERFGVDAGQRKPSLPSGVRKGLARAVLRLYNERSALKWDSSSSGVRMGDVLELVHPEPVAAWQSHLFKFLLDQRHHGDGFERLLSVDELGPDLPTLEQHSRLSRLPVQERRLMVTRSGSWEQLRDAGFTWERVSSWIDGPMTADVWETVIPSMGVMALLRNLRNFDDAGIGREAQEHVTSKLISPEDVAASKVLPYRVYSAYAHAPSDEWKLALGRTLELSSRSVPELDGALLVIDTSGSMSSGGLSRRSKVAPVTVAALQAATLAKRGKNVDVVLFGQHSTHLDQVHGDWRRHSVLSTVELIEQAVGSVGHSTYGNSAIARWYEPRRHKHVLVFTDGQMHDDDALIQHVPHVTTFLVGGYAPVSAWGRGRVTVAGFSDQVLRIVAEHVQSA